MQFLWVHLHFQNVHPADGVGKGLEVGFVNLGKNAFWAFVGRTLHDIAQVLKAQHLTWNLHKTVHGAFQFKLRPFYELESRFEVWFLDPKLNTNFFR